MQKVVIFLKTMALRAKAAAACMQAPEGWMLVISEPTKKRAQEEKYHAMLSDIAKQVEFFGKRRDPETVKRLLVDAFCKVMKDAGTPVGGDGGVLPSLDGERVVQLGVQTRRFTVREASEFVEHLYAFGAENNVKWSEPRC